MAPREAAAAHLAPGSRRHSLRVNGSRRRDWSDDTGRSARLVPSAGDAAGPNEGPKRHVWYLGANNAARPQVEPTRCNRNPRVGLGDTTPPRQRSMRYARNQRGRARATQRRPNRSERGAPEHVRSDRRHTAPLQKGRTVIVRNPRSRACVTLRRLRRGGRGTSEPPRAGARATPRRPRKGRRSVIDPRIGSARHRAARQERTMRARNPHEWRTRSTRNPSSRFVRRRAVRTASDTECSEAAGWQALATPHRPDRDVSDALGNNKAASAHNTVPSRQGRTQRARIQQGGVPAQRRDVSIGTHALCSESA